MAAKSMLESNRESINPIVKKLDFDRLIWKISNSSGGTNLSAKDLKNAVDQYRKFLTLKAKYPKAELVPTEEIDLIWHSHILDTRRYSADCKKLFGRFLHHGPFFGPFSTETQEEMGVRFNETSKLWKREFAESIQEPNQFRCEDKKCHAPSNCRCR